MNKAEARKYAKRIIAGYIEELFHSSKDPLVYDEEFPEEVQGRRMSKADRERVEDAVIEISEKFNEQGWTPLEVLQDFRRPFVPHKVDGKPGSKWKKYEDWRKRQGRK